MTASETTYSSQVFGGLGSNLDCSNLVLLITDANLVIRMDLSMQRTNLSNGPAEDQFFDLPEFDIDNFTANNEDLGNDTVFISALASLEPVTGINDACVTTMENSTTDPGPQASNGGQQTQGPRSPTPDVKSGRETKRKRSSIACRACHDKRVRCDAVSCGLPCSNCRLRSAECSFIDSKRCRSVHESYAWFRLFRMIINFPVFCRGRHGRFEESKRNGSRRTPSQQQIVTRSQVTYDSTMPPHESFTRPHIETVPRGESRSGTNLSGSFRCSNSIADCGQMIHIGESSLFSWLLSDRLDSEKVHQTIKLGLNDMGYATSETTGDDKRLIGSQRLEKCLLDSFCQNFLPLYPVLNKDKFISRWISGKVSPLLKQTIFFIGALHAQISIITNAGFSCRQDATEYFYHKARHLYDNDVELDRVTIVQSTFMLQFRFGPAPSHRDCFWWASMAISVAQTIGMHRSTKNTTISPEDRRLWKKIWWLLFVNHSSLSFTFLGSSD